MPSPLDGISSPTPVSPEKLLRARKSSWNLYRAWDGKGVGLILALRKEFKQMGEGGPVHSMNIFTLVSGVSDFMGAPWGLTGLTH